MFAILLSLLACNEVEPQPVPVPVVDWADVPCNEEHGFLLPDDSHVVNVLGCISHPNNTASPETCSPGFLDWWTVGEVVDASELIIPEGQYVSAQCGDAEFYRVTWIEQP